MKKFLIVMLFIAALVVSCRASDQNKTLDQNTAPVQNKPESVLLYFCDPDTEAICYRDLASDQPEAFIPLEHYYFDRWVSPEKVLLSKYADSYDSDEYYMFDLKTKSLECITCSLNSTSYKSLSSSMDKVFLYADGNLSMVDLNQPDKVEDILSGSTFWPDLSPDESFLVFADPSMHLYRLNIKDRSRTELLKGISPLNIFDVEISPTGDKVAFYILDENKNFSLATVSVDGTDFQALADLTPQQKRMIDTETSPSMFTWSPNGKEIAFTAPLESDPTGYQRGIFIVDLDQKKPKLILDSPTNKISPAWSPDGSLIAFVDGKTQDIWTIAPDGTNLKNQTNTPERAEWGPTWK